MTKNISLLGLIILIPIFLLNCSQNDSGKTAFEDPPEWSKEVIWYQIFVERFRNGDPSNDPTKADIVGNYPGFVPESWEITPWTQDWYKEDPYFAEAAARNDLNGNPISSFGQKAQLRRYGGDLQGVLDAMEYIDSLGVTAIYFNPLNDAPSLHKYDARNWRHVDVNFGPTPEEDKEIMAQEDPLDPTTWQMTGADKMFLQVVDEFHKRDIKVILDYSWNHTGIEHWAWKDVLENGRDSKYADWYWVKSFDDPDTEEDEFEFRGWLGVSTLPEIKETAKQAHDGPVELFEGDVYSDDAKQLIFNVTRRWLDPNGDGDPSDGIDGYRLDVAAEMPLGFWRQYREVVREVNPDAYLLGEIWWKEFPDHLMDPEPLLKGDIFDAPMNYRWYRSTRHFFNQSPNKITVTEYVDSLKSYSSNLREQSNYAMMNLTASHDVPRFSTSIYNKNKYKYNASAAADPNYKVDKPDAETYETMKLILAQQFTYVGSPQIWAGDEMGMWGGDDPDTRKPLIWPDYEFEDETTHPLGKSRPRNEVAFNRELFDHYRKLIRIRNTNPVLATGMLEYALIDDENETLAYSRFDGENEVIAVFNSSSEPKSIRVRNKLNRSYQDVLNDVEVSVVGDGLSITLEAREAAILKSADLE